MNDPPFPSESCGKGNNLSQTIRDTVLVNRSSGIGYNFPDPRSYLNLVRISPSHTRRAFAQVLSHRP